MLLDRSSLAIQEQLADAVASPSAHAVRREQAVILADALARLPADYREVFILRNLEQIPVDEIKLRAWTGQPTPSVNSGAALWSRSSKRWRTHHEHEPLVAHQWPPGWHRR